MRQLFAICLLGFSFVALGQVRDDYNPGDAVVNPGPGAPPIALGGGTVLYDNGPLVNSPGTGVGGADESVLQTTSLGMNTLGFGHQVLNDNRVADDFTVAASVGWIVDDITFFAYQTGSTTTSTMTGTNVNIWDGPPAAVGSNIVASSAVLSTTGWTGIYRVTEATTGTASDRPIMANVVDFGGIVLPQGTYWLDWQADGSLGSGPWAPPITIGGTAVTGNGLQSLDAGVTFAPANDSGTGTPQQGFPFIIQGSLAVSVPTMGTYAMIAFLVLLAGTAIWFTRTRMA